MMSSRDTKHSRKSLFYSLLISALGGVLTYGILWSAHYREPALLMVQSWLVPVLAFIAVSDGQRRFGQTMRHPLIAIVAGYFISLAEILMIRELEAPALPNQYYPIIRKR